MCKEEIIKRIEGILEAVEKMKNAWFYRPPCMARERREYEKRWSCDTIEWQDGGHHYTAAYTVTCTCNRVYARGYYTRDGYKTSLTAIRNSLQRLRQD